jgi:hypothetical protein
MRSSLHSAATDSMEELRKHPLIRAASSYIIGLVVLFFMMVIVVLGTLYQTKFGIHRSQELFFDSWFFIYPGTFRGVHAPIPLPGMALLCLILFCNILIATIFRIRFRKKIIGVYIAHAGILVLLGGGFITTFMSVEGMMKIKEGKSVNFSTRYYEKEIVVKRWNAEKRTDAVTSIGPIVKLRKGTAVSTAQTGLPFDILIEEVFVDAVVDSDEDGGFARANAINHGFTTGLKIVPEPPRGEDHMLVSAIVSVPDSGGGEPKRFILSDLLVRDVIIPHEGVDYRLQLRNRRDYYSFSIFLRDFQREEYVGTRMNKSYASEVTFMEPDRDLEMNTRIYMNHPLRYGTFTFFQASFEENDTVTGLAVVKNIGMPFPYIATVIISIGLLVQFLTGLTVYQKKRAVREAAA